MDWKGQKLAEELMQILLLVFSVVGFVSGYLTGSFQMMVFVFVGGVFLTTLITVPNWPFFNRKPLKWLDPIEAEKHPKPQPQQPLHYKKKFYKKIFKSSGKNQKQKWESTNKGEAASGWTSTSDILSGGGDRLCHTEGKAKKK